MSRSQPLISLIMMVLAAAGMLAAPGCRRTHSGTVPGTLPPNSSVASGTSALNAFPEPVRVLVTQGGYEFDGRTYGFDDANCLAADMKAAAGGDMSVPAVVIPTGNVEWSRVVGAFTALKKAGFRKIGFAQQL